VEEVEEAIGGMAVMARVWKETELSMEKYHGIACLEEIFR
jgi:hypothetical protein